VNWRTISPIDTEYRAIHEERQVLPCADRERNFPSLSLLNLPMTLRFYYDLIHMTQSSRQPTLFMHRTARAIQTRYHHLQARREAAATVDDDDDMMGGMPGGMGGDMGGLFNDPELLNLIKDPKVMEAMQDPTKMAALAADPKVRFLTLV
jgi:hypothetical protein